ncbi:hypothetical protein TthWC1_2372 [Thermoanaerobacter thermohydrosulfuricus WC1]|uniref:Uncharacterized protein n=1 Tax=Thermoanaerobacter thermohydrosulfuricus WC1 TaxID=1198630 RepID=M8DDK7_THETY|nr:hypothetical protein [Thermoanaerobacter thermohydrosulfuricus]EMT38122.1 hypothetical protein TthWC1_2372 [Thermoanaerobacter thermohydrosulfuricus WC1]
MIPMPELRTKLRKLLDEQIPAGGSDADTRFLDADIDELLNEATNIYEAAATGWTLKAAMLQRELGQVESYSVGQERYDMRKLQDMVNYALKMAETYSRMAASSMGSVILRIQPPEVL